MAFLLCIFREWNAKCDKIGRKDNLIFVLGSAESSETIPELCGDGILPECHKQLKKSRLFSSLVVTQLGASDRDVQPPRSSNENSIYLVKFVFPPFAHPISTIPAFIISESIFDDSNAFAVEPEDSEFELDCNGFQGWQGIRILN